MKTIVSALTVFLALQLCVYATPQEEVDRSAATVREFRHMPEKAIPRSVLRHSRGLAIMRLAKGAFVFSGKAGNGVVVARTGNGWSGPSFITTGGAGWGAQIGGEVTDVVFVLNNAAAVRAFSRGGNVTLGGELSAAAGPVGRDAQVAVAPTAAIYTYSRSKGLFAGASLEGAVIATRDNTNHEYYGRNVTAGQILSGHVKAPSGSARLRAAL